MEPDVNTLLLVTIYVEVLLGLLLLFVWMQNARIHAVAWWGFAHLVRAGSIVLFGMYGSTSELISIDLANTLLFTAFAMTWTGARVFDGRPVQPTGLLVGAALWLFASRMLIAADSVELRVLLSNGIIAAYTWLTAYEIWRGRSEPLVSRWPAVFMLFAHGALFLLRTPLSVMLPGITSQKIFTSVWLTVPSFEALLFTISVAFILLAMAKERSEHLYKTAALIDPLTGLPNRRAFLDALDRLVLRQAKNKRPLALLLIDFDHFKSINDRFGHSCGDRALQIFAEIVRAELRPFDYVGRIGGEEFAVALPDVGREGALLVAERIRTSLAATASLIDGHPVRSTVSIGVVVSNGLAADACMLLALADEALYRAKERGRNRVEFALPELVCDDADRQRRHIAARARSAA